MKRLQVVLITITACFLFAQLCRSESPTGIPTELTLFVSTASEDLPGMITLDANVKALNQNVTSGAVVFEVDQKVIGSAQIDGAGRSAAASGSKAEIKVALAPGAHLITARYTSSGSYQPSESQLVSVIGPGFADGPLTIEADDKDNTRVNFRLQRSSVAPAGSLVLRNAATGEGIQSLHMAALTKNSSVDQVSAMSLGKQPSYVGYKDVNGDGIPDLLVSDFADGTVTILIGDRDQIHFTKSSVVQIGGNPGHIVFGDFNNDGLVDVAVLDTLSGDIHLLMNSPTLPGNLQKYDATIQAGQGTLDLVAADLNGDGTLDIASVNFITSEVSVFLGNPKSVGTFALSEQIAIPGGVGALALGNVYGGSNPDLVVVARNTGFVYALRNNQDNLGSFSIPDSGMYAGVGSSAVTIADINGDGSADIAVANSQSASITLLFSVKGHPGLFPTALDLPVGNDPTQILFVPASTNSSPKLLVCNHDDGTVEIVEAGAKSDFRQHQVIQVGITTDSLAANAEMASSDVNLWAIADRSAGVVRLISDAIVSTGSWTVGGTAPQTTASVYATFEQEPGQSAIGSNTVILPVSKPLNGNTTTTSATSGSSSTPTLDPIVGSPLQIGTLVNGGSGQSPTTTLKGGPQRGPEDGGIISPAIPTNPSPIWAAIPKFGVLPILLPRFSLTGGAKKISPQIELKEAVGSTKDENLLQLAMEASMSHGLLPKGQFIILVDGVATFSVDSVGRCCFTIAVDRFHSGVHRYQVHFMGDNVFADGYSNVYWTSDLGQVPTGTVVGGDEQGSIQQTITDVAPVGPLNIQGADDTPTRGSEPGSAEPKHGRNDRVALREPATETSVSRTGEGLDYFDPRTVLFRRAISKFQIAFPAPRPLSSTNSRRTRIRKPGRRTAGKRGSIRQPSAGCLVPKRTSHAPR